MAAGEVSRGGIHEPARIFAYHDSLLKVSILGLSSYSMTIGGASGSPNTKVKPIFMQS